MVEPRYQGGQEKSRKDQKEVAENEKPRGLSAIQDREKRLLSTDQGCQEGVLEQLLGTSHRRRPMDSHTIHQRTQYRYDTHPDST